MTHELAGKPAPRDMLTSIPKLITDYYTVSPDVHVAAQRVAFGTSGHRGVSSAASFNEAHILAITQAVCEYRRAKGIDGPLFLGADTHALSEPARVTALEVLAANDIPVCYQAGDRPVPTPVISHAILNHNRQTGSKQADGIVITPSHNPPDAGGFKYNPPHGGPADTGITGQIENRANDLLASGNTQVKRVPLARALTQDAVRPFDFITPYVKDLDNVLDMKAIAGQTIRIGVDPMGGAGIDYWAPIASHYGLDITVVNPVLDPTFSFMTLDHDGQIRMDCSSRYAMASLIEVKTKFDIAFGNDPDADRHGIVTSTGLMNPNHYLSVAVEYLFSHRPDWPAQAAVGKTLVSSSIIDRVVHRLGRRLYEVPVGFKWFVDGLMNGHLGFGGEESAGASFLRKDGTVWTTDKDGIILNLLAVEIAAVTDMDPSEHYARMTREFGTPLYERIDVVSSPEEKEVLATMTPDDVSAHLLANEPIIEKITRAPGNDAPVGGLKVTAENGWFAARPSGTENIYKIYAESFSGEGHLRKIQNEAREMIAATLDRQ